MKIASWNVNGIRARVEHVKHWLTTSRPDVLALQETKVVDDLFPFDAFESIGYQAVVFGQKAYNGVALLTKNKKRTRPKKTSFLSSFGGPRRKEKPRRRKK